MERKDRGGKTSMVNKVDREVRKINDREDKADMGDGDWASKKEQMTR